MYRFLCNFVDGLLTSQGGTDYILMAIESLVDCGSQSRIVDFFHWEVGHCVTICSISQQVVNMFW